MASKKKFSKSKVDQQLLDDIFLLKKEWMNLKIIIEKSIEPSEIGLFDLSVAEVKYFYLLREARQRKISALR